MDDRTAQKDALRERVCRLLKSADIRVNDLDVERGEVSAAVAITNTYGAIDRGQITVGRRPKYPETDMWHTNMGDPDCLDLAELIQITLSGLGFHVTWDHVVPNQVGFTVRAEEAADAVAT